MPTPPTPQREEQFLVACFEDGGGQGFDYRAVGERLGMGTAESDALARALASRGVFQALSPSGEGVFTPDGRAAARDLLKAKGKDPSLWTNEQRAYLKTAFQTAGPDNRPYNGGAIAKAANLPTAKADSLRTQLIQRGILADSRQMRTFTPEGLAVVRDHFAKNPA